MDDLRDATYRGDDLVLNPGATCPNRRDRKHAGRWLHGALDQPHSNVVRTKTRFVCMSCGLTMDVAIDCWIPDGMEIATSGEWAQVKERRHE